MRGHADELDVGMGEAKKRFLHEMGILIVPLAKVTCMLLYCIK